MKRIKLPPLSEHRTVYYTLNGWRWSLTEGQTTQWGKHRLHCKILAIRNRVHIEYWTGPETSQRTWVKWSSLVCKREGLANDISL